MNNEIFSLMLSQHATHDELGQRNALYETMQQVALAGLYRGGFFKEAAFYGGTCLRLFHNLGRYSEDMDFTMVHKNPDFRFEDYFPYIVAEAEALGRMVEIKKKDKVNFGRVESAFLKDTTDVYNLKFTTEKTLKIKIEIDTNPPLGFDTEEHLMTLPFSFHVRCLTLPNLFAGKLHALVFRQWKTRVKGRDWYDFEWYVRRHVPLNWSHLHNRILEFTGEDLSRADFEEAMRQRLATTNIDDVKRDVLPFIIDPRDLDFWSNDYFLTLAERIKWEE